MPSMHVDIASREAVAIPSFANLLLPTCFPPNNGSIVNALAFETVS